MLRTLEMPLTAMGQNLVLPKEIEKKALVLYHENSDGLSFAGLYNPDVPDEDYKDGIVAVPFRSTFLRVDTFPATTKVWNVQKSSDDNVYVDINHKLGNLTDMPYKHYNFASNYIAERPKSYRSHRASEYSQHLNCHA